MKRTKGFGVLGFGMLLAAFSASLTQADEHFRIERNDPSVPTHCRAWNIESFGSVEGSVFYSIEGGVDAGFTDEIDLKRHEASTLWAYAKPSPTAGHPPEALASLFEILQGAKRAMGFDYSKEGDVLEALTLLDLQNQFPPSQYFTTGGLSYHQPAIGKDKSTTLGELDVIVGRKSDCAIVVIGEAKLGVRQINHARDQIKRFVTFAKGKLCRGSEGNSRPICRL